MPSYHFKQIAVPVVLACTLFLAPATHPQQALPFDSASAQKASIGRSVRADMNFLADDELRGRGSATRDEHIAILFAAAQLQTLGLEPMGDKETYIQKTPLGRSLLRKIPGREEGPRRETWNALAMLRGSSRPNEVVLLTAHIDHLGVGRLNPLRPGADVIYNGADDDASGTAAVLTLARLLSRGPRPERSILFVLFGSEEIGGLGNSAFLEHPPISLDSIVANLEFEMIGRPDPAVPAGTLWLTGFNRSTLGADLAKHGAHLVNDPHTKEDFFQRSDNYALALQGVVAHTISSYGMHHDYHRPSDELRTIDYSHMTEAIASMVGPIRWLADSSYKPVWNPKGRPTKR